MCIFESVKSRVFRRGVPRMLFISSFGVAARESEKPSVVNFSELISMILGDLFPELFPVVGKKAAEIFKPVVFTSFTYELQNGPSRLKSRDSR